MKKQLSTILLTGLLAVGLGACGGGNTSNPANTSTGGATSNPGNNNSTVISSSQAGEESPIKSLTAVSETVEVKIGEQATLANYYELKGVKSLSAKQKKVTITSSDENVVKVASTYKTMTAVNIGSAVITVTSDVDATKVCTFTVNVTESFFDRSLTSISSSWDVAHEMDAENPYIKIDSNLSDGIYARGSDGLKWYIETEITIHSINTGEEWPKFGIVANTTTNTTDTTNNKLYYFLDAPMNREGNWTNFGVCEVSNGANWAWNAGIGNNEARHNDAVSAIETPLTYETKFSIGMLRDGFDCHLFANGSYIGTVTVLGSLFGNYDSATQDYTQPVNCMAGFFSFNSVVTFSNYKFVNDEAAVDALKPAEVVYNTNWADD